MKKKLFEGLILLVTFLLIGCAHYVEFKSPDTYQYEKTVPLKVVFYMDKSMKDKMYYGRAASSGIANRWDIPVGNVVHQYANAYLKNGFKEFNETEALDTKPIHDILTLVSKLRIEIA